MAIRIGIVGDGQLGMLLCEAAAELEISTAILTSSASSAAAHRADTAVVGSMDDAQAVSQLVNCSDIITYEREDVSPLAIEILREAESAGQIVCYPRLATIETLQDKALQKTWLAAAKLPTLPFLVSDGADGAANRAANTLGYPLVQKSLRGGFDGRGVQIINGPENLHDAWPGQTLFEAHAGDFAEIAVMVIRKADGEVRTFPPVDMTFNTDHSVLDWVLAPSAFDDSILEQAQRIATAAITALDGIGVFGVELFRLENGAILINEISPRVHNAGHFTLDATESSQFEQHLRAITGMPLSGTALRRSAAMRNLLCDENLKSAAQGRSAGCDRDGDTAVYWYGKSPSRAMRKLGHITATSDNSTDAAEKVAQAYARLTDTQAETVA